MLNSLVKMSLPGRALEALRYLRYGQLKWDQSLPIIGMISKEEEDFYFACARRLRNMNSAIVDLGCWMGRRLVRLRGVQLQRKATVLKKSTEFMLLIALSGKVG